jgi:hypothetical protein
MRDPVHERLSVAEVFGLTPIGERLREAAVALRGDALTPRSRFDHTSLRMFRPRMALPLWLGRPAAGRLVPIYNLYNYNQAPPEGGWSVRVTNARDFLGTQLTYDSHNGTDFAVPIGTVVVAAAPGRVVRISREFNRGGLKVFLDHGNGLVTTSNHLGRALVRVGDHVGRGDVIARSAYSGLDGLTTFPFGAPHVHFNVWLNGAYVDPFSSNDVPLWCAGNWPVPWGGARSNEAVAATDWNHDAVRHAIEACVHDGSRSEIERAVSPDECAITAMFHMNYYPTRFRERPQLYQTTHPRAPTLDLPFRAADFDGIMFPHGAEPPRISP